jgi:hypothetical protein
MTRDELIEALVETLRREVDKAVAQRRHVAKVRATARKDQNYVAHNPVTRDSDGYWDNFSPTRQAVERGMGARKVFRDDPADVSFPWRRFAKSSYHRSNERKWGPHAFRPGKHDGWVYGHEQD